MDAILSRVGLSDAELRQHCVAAVQDELQQATTRVQGVVSALERALKVVQASQELHQSLVLNDSEQVQASFRQLGESCNQIGPLLRLLHRNMGATPSAEPEQSVATTSVAVAPTASVFGPGIKPAPPSSTDSSCSTASEYELSSDDEDEDDEPEVVEVAPPRSSKKRKAATLDLSPSPMPAAKRKPSEQDTKALRDELKNKLKEVQAIPTAGYTVTIHKELASFVRNIFVADKLDDWQPRDDPALGRLLNEMGSGMAVFKDSAAQSIRRKAMDDWQKEMVFSPSLDLTSIPPKQDPRVALKVPGCRNSQELKQFAKPGVHIWAKFRADTSTNGVRKQKYFQPLLEATVKFFEAVVATKAAHILVTDASQCNHSLRLLSSFGGRDGTGLSRAQGAQLEKLLYFLRLAMHKNDNLRTKAVNNFIADLLKLFPRSAQPNFSYPQAVMSRRRKTK